MTHFYCATTINGNNNDFYINEGVMEYHGQSVRHVNGKTLRTNDMQQQQQQEKVQS